MEMDCLGDYPRLGHNSTISIASYLFGGSCLNLQPDEAKTPALLQYVIWTYLIA